jgi:hypothetical protein
MGGAEAGQHRNAREMRDARMRATRTGVKGTGSYVHANQDVLELGATLSIPSAKQVQARPHGGEAERRPSRRRGALARKVAEVRPGLGCGVVLVHVAQSLPCHRKTGVSGHGCAAPQRLPAEPGIAIRLFYGHLWATTGTPSGASTHPRMS